MNENYTWLAVTVFGILAESGKKFSDFGKKKFFSNVSPGWNCLNLLHVFVGYQANFPWFYKILKKTSMQQNFTDSI